MKLKITKDFPFAHRGVEVRHYEAGADVETDDPDLVKVACAEKWAEPADEAAKAVLKPAKPAKA